MAITYTWKVTGLKTATINDASDVIVQTYWEKIGKDGEFEGKFLGATPFSINSMPAGTTFIPFSELTEEDVLTWIKAVVVGSYGDHVNSQIQKQIDEKKNPAIEATLPWASAANTN
jgi:hypothetical protein